MIEMKKSNISVEQMKAFRKLILDSKDGNSFGKEVMLWLINNSDHLTRPVAVNIPTSIAHEFAYNAATSVHDMLSSNGTTYLNELIRLMGSPLHFSHHCGQYATLGLIQNDKRSFSSKLEGYTIWLTPEYYGHNHEVTVFDMDEELFNHLKKIADLKSKKEK